MSIDLSLDRINRLLSYFSYTRPTIHVAGTNGKGSISAMLSSVFSAVEEPAIVVGRFNSPHLITVRDAISINKRPVDEETYNSCRETVLAKDKEENTGCSSFELLTVTALYIFEHLRADIVICEVGMGGRLDATNAIPTSSILLSVIGSIDLDHQAFLGSTIAQIAREKAGIVRSGKTVVLGAQTHVDATAVVRDVARSVDATIVSAATVVDREWDTAADGSQPPPFSIEPFHPPPPRPVQSLLSNYGTLPIKVLLPLQGDHQLGNLGIVLSVLNTLRGIYLSSPTQHDYPWISQLDSQTIHRGLRQCSWPGRLSFHQYTPRTLRAPLPTPTIPAAGPQKKKLTILADGAHNPASSGVLEAYITQLISGLTSSTNINSGLNDAPPFESEQSGTGSLSTSLESNAEMDVKITITYILALSHSPPKTPADVLVPLLTRTPLHPNHTYNLNSSTTTSNASSLLASVRESASPYISIHARICIALVRFTPPAGMPWVRPVPPEEMKSLVSDLVPGAEVVVFSQSQHETGAETGASEEEEEEGSDVVRALAWAASDGEEEPETKPGSTARSLSLVIIAGSLYLIADLYRELIASGEVIPYLSESV